MVVNNTERISLKGRIFDRLKELVASLPDKAADLYLGDDAAGKVVTPDFRIVPTNPRSAPIEGFVSDRFGVEFAIGQATNGELYLASWSSKRNKAKEDKFFDICRAVFTTHFSEDVTYSSASRVLRSRIMLRVDERTIRIGGHQIFWWLYPRRTTKHFSYEPYY